MGRGPAYYGKGFDIIWVGGQINMDRGSKCHRHLIHHRRGGYNTFDRGFYMP
jgi:hypothetical protein